MFWETLLAAPPFVSHWAQLGSTAILPTLLLAAVVLMVILALGGFKPNELNKVPGPPGAPVLGNLKDIGHARGHQAIAGWAQRWPTFRFKLLHMDSVCLTNPADIAPLINRGKEELPKASMIYSPLDKIYSPTGIPSFFTTQDSEMWSAVRKGCAPAFSPDNLRKEFPLIRDTVETVCDALAAQAQRPGAAEEGVDVSEATLRVALDVFGQTAFGHDFQARTFGPCIVLETLPPLLAEFSARALDPLRAVKHGLMPWLEDAQSFKRNRQAAYQLWAELAREVLETDVAAAEASGDSSLRVCLAKLKDPATGEPLTQAQLEPHVAAFLVGGFETTGHSAAWALYEIASHPEVQAKLAAELEQAGLLWAPGRPGRELELSDLSALPYLDQAWKEALRLHPVASVGPVRQADREVVLRDGVRCPAGTMVWCSIIAVHLSPFNFVDPYRFWPERWEQPAEGSSSAKVAEGGEAKPANEAPDTVAGRCPMGALGHATPAGNSAAPGRSFMAFSYGSRDCLGQALGNMEGKAMLAMLCSRFEFCVAPRMGTPEEVRATEVNRLTLQPGNGMWLQLTPRGGR